MSDTFIIKIKNGDLDFGSDYNRFRFNDYLKKNEGKIVEIRPKANIVSDQMRGYMFGVVIPFLKQLGNEWRDLNDDQVYEMLKKNFNYFEAYNPVTKRKERFARSVMNVSVENKKAMEFVMRIGGYIMENYNQTLPDPSEFKEWRDSAPMKGEEYKKS